MIFYGLRLLQIEKEKESMFTGNSANLDLPPLTDNSSIQKNTATNTAIPEFALLSVAFTTQAPLANWDALHEETCEEASLLMVKKYRDKTSIASPTETDKEIISIVNFEDQNGYKVDVTVSELSQIASAFYGMKTGRVIQNAAIDDIKRELTNGRPVIIPAAGKLLNNPNFRNGGPVYHMLVIKGYDENGFITNDPGTRNGNNYRYNFDLLFNAIHDWDPNDINQGKKNILVFD